MNQEIPKELILSVENISNSYGNKPLLQKVSFELEAGEILCLLGPSGSGKTTLLRLIAGLEAEYSGQIHFDGENIQAKPPHKRGFGLMFQEYALFPHKNIEENISFGLEMQGLDQTQQRHQVDKMLKLVGLSGFNKRRIDDLSGGEKQRVALARSLAPEPLLLLLDEPLGSLDRMLRERLTIEIRSILKELGVTAVFVTHDQNEAFGIADKIAILINGVLEQFTQPEDLYRYPVNSSVARFLGFTNLIEVSIASNVNIISSPFGTVAPYLPSHIKPTEPVLLLRPEGAKITNTERPNQTAGLKIQGLVKARQYQGATYNLEIESHSHSLHFDVPLEPPPPDIGSHIELTLEPTSILLIENN